MGKDQDIIKAVKDNDKATLQKLLQKVSKQGKNKIIGGSKKLSVNFQDADGMSALHQAALMSSSQMLQMLLDQGATPALRDNKGMTALHYSAWQGVPQPVHILLHKGSPVNEQALNGDIPLHLACQHGHLDVTTLLLNHQADPTICNKDLRTSLDLACQFGHTKVVESLLRSNLCQKLLEDSPTDLLDSSRTTCLHLAAKNGHIEIIKLLLQAGININRSTQKGTCLHEATLAGKTDVVHFLLDWGADVNKPNACDQTALDTVQKLASCDSSRELIHLLKEASCAQYARAVKDHSNVYDSGNLEFREGDIITVLEQRSDGIWRGYLYREGRMAKTGVFPANHVMLIDSKVLVRHQEPIQTRNICGQVPDLLNRGPSYCSSHSSSTSQPCSSSDRGSMENSTTDEATAYSFPPTPSANFPPPPSAMLASYPPRGPVNRDFKGADSGFSSLHSLPHGVPPSPGGHQQFGKCLFAFGPALSVGNNSAHSHPHNPHSGCGQEQQLKRHQPHNGEGSAPAPTSLPAPGGVCGDMRGSSPAKDSPGHSNRNSAASSDSGRGCSTGHSDVKSGHNYVNVQVNTQQNRLSGQSSESGVSSRQSYHSSSSSSHGSLDPLEEPGFTSTINVTQLFQAGVPDNEVLHAWLHDLHFEEYYPLFVQAGYDLPTISRMTPEDLTAVGITKPAHRKRLKAEIARLNIPDGIPDYRPNDLMEWLHLLGLGDYLDTLCGQGYDSIDYVTDITWEDLEDIGIRKLGHQKKIMLAIDRLKRITSGVKHLSLVDGRTASLELLEPPPPAPPITGRWSDGEATAIPLHVYDGARPKKSPSGDSISTTGSGTSGGSAGSGAQSCAGGNIGAGGEVKVISLPQEDVGLAGAIPYRHSSTGSSGSSNLQPDIISVQVRKNVRSCTSDDNGHSANGQQLMYHSFQGSLGQVSDSELFLENYSPRSFETDGRGYTITGAGIDDRHRPVAKVTGKTETENHEKEAHGEGSTIGTNVYAQKYGLNNNINNNVALRVDTGEHIYDTPQISQSPKSPKPSVMPKPSPSSLGMAGPLHVNTASEPSFAGQANLSPGGKSGKRIPPPPPVRTNSVRIETAVERTPSSPVKVPVVAAVVTASPVHQHPTAVITPKQQPPPVMQKPQKPVAVASQPHSLYSERSQPPQHSLSPLVSQKLKSPSPLSQKVIILPTSNPHLHSPTPGPGTQQVPGFCRPQNTPQQHLQPKSPLLTKAPLAAMVTSVPKHQQQLPHHQPLPQHIHKAHPTSAAQSLGIAQQPRNPVVSPSHHYVPTSSLPGHSEEPQVKAFANCVKSLSEKFGKNTQEDDQFPDNVSTDSDDFPPPPPPIAMDIITPKIHNYGIPSSRDRRKPDFGLQHHRDYTHKPRPTAAAALSGSPVKGVHPELAQRNVNQGHHAHTSMIIAAAKILPEHLAAVQLRKQPPVSSASSQPSPGAEQDPTPEPDSMNAISKEKRSESTSSFESNSSSSSIDSNTLPFANENVGTIKQRVVTGKPLGGQSGDQENGQRTLDQNSDMFDRGIHRNVSGYSDSYCSSASPSLRSRHRSSSMSESTNSSVYSSEVHYRQRSHQRQLSNPSFSGALQPPVPSKKPAVSPKPARPTVEQSSLSSSSSSAAAAAAVAASEMSQKQEPVTEEGQSQTGNVLSDIDNMLQGLTDQLDAMLEEEMGGS